jgi:hypothetical protein
MKNEELRKWNAISAFSILNTQFSILNSQYL